jgi:hypothetical protein
MLCGPCFRSMRSERGKASILLLTPQHSVVLTKLPTKASRSIQVLQLGVTPRFTLPQF